MRILITSDIFPPDVGGPATYVPIIARELAARGHAVRVLTYSHVEHFAADSEYPFQVERIVLRGPRLSRLLRTTQRIATQAKQADIWYINGLLMESGWVNRLLRKPSVAKVVGDIAWERARDKSWTTEEFESFQTHAHDGHIRLRQNLRNQALHQTQAVITPSSYLRRIVTDWGIPAAKVHVVYNACEFSLTDSSSPAIPLDTQRRLVTICRLTSWKGIDGLLEALAPLSTVGLVVVGEGPERDKLVALAQRLGLANRVYFAGQLAHDQIGAYLRACDLFVLNSHYEGLPHVVLEALAAGLPVVATDVGGMAEVVQHGANGYLVHPGDTDSLRRAIVEALGDEGLRAHCAADRARVVQQFSVPVMADATEHILETVVQSQTRR